MKFKKIFSWCIISIVFCSGVCYGSENNKTFSIGGAGSGGGYYILGGAIGNLMTVNGMPSSVQTTGGGRQNAVLVDRGDIDFGFANVIEINEVLAKSKEKNIRAVVTAFPGYHHFIVRDDQPIKTVRDIDGKVYGLTSRGSTHDVAGREVFKALGIKPKRIVNADRSDSGNMIQDGLIAGYFMSSGYPISSIMELQTNVTLRYLPFTEKDYYIVKEKCPWLSEAIIPAGTYKDLKDDLKTFKSWNIMIAQKDVPEDVVYKLLKIIFNNTKEIQETYRAAEFDTDAISTLSIPLHPGAVKFYKENGVNLPGTILQ